MLEKFWFLWYDKLNMIGMVRKVGAKLIKKLIAVFLTMAFVISTATTAFAYCPEIEHDPPQWNEAVYADEAEDDIAVLLVIWGELKFQDKTNFEFFVRGIEIFALHTNWIQKLPCCTDMGYYVPQTGRFLSQDTHWGPHNMIYGDNPKDPLGLGIYRPDIRAIMQSSNLYVYCGNNPIMYKDSSGKFWDIILDIGGIIWSAADLINDPSWANAGFLLLDVGSALVPFVPAAGSAIKVATKADNVVKVVGKFDNVADATKAGVKLTNAQQAMIAINKGEKLTDPMKNALRTDARKIMDVKVTAARQAGKQVDSIHHIVPLEYAHKMGSGFNPNAMSNLAGVSASDHGKINAMWNSFRAANPNPTQKQITDMVNQVNKQFGTNFVR